MGAATRAAAVLVVAVVFAAGAAARQIDDDAGPNRNLLQQRLDCTRVHRACSVCRSQRIKGSLKTELVCSQCRSGWRLRKDGSAKICDCAPGLAFNGTDTSTAMCAACPLGKYCVGGDKNNPTNVATDCTTGLTTKFAGAKSEAQCFTLPGYGRRSVRSANGKITYTAVVCPLGTYNVGGNTRDCEKCPPDTTTLSTGSSSATACYARPGYFLNKGAGQKCPKGAYTTSYNQATECTYCPPGTITVNEGSTNITACNRALPGYFMSDAYNATECPLHTYNPAETAATSCTQCPNGWFTQMTGQTGVASCMAPPGYELKPNATQMTPCEPDYYKINWNRNPCVPCGQNLFTFGNGSTSLGDCKVPAGYGLISLNPPTAIPCTNNTYGGDSEREVVADSTCQPCGANMFTNDTLTGVPATEPYMVEEECLVAPGWGRSGEQIIRCELGTYSLGFHREACETCPTATTTFSVGADSESLCWTQPGWFASNETGIAAPCDKGTYSTGGTALNPGAECVPCPTGFTTQEDESVKPSDCSSCTAGYGGTNCTWCPVDTFSSGDVAEGLACSACPSGTTSRRRSINVDMCYTSIIDPNSNVFSLNNASLWTNVSSATTETTCRAACDADTACIAMRISEDLGCQTFLETPSASPAVRLGVKVPGVDDAAVYTIPAGVTLGQLSSDKGSRTLAGCLAACLSGENPCELFLSATSDATTPGSCKLYVSELDSDFSGSLHLVGSRLYSDSLLA